MTQKEFNKLDDSRSSFELIKEQSEPLWEKIKIDLHWGFQIQQGSKWKKGLSEKELTDFQSEMNMIFPEALKNFYRTMNGLDKPGLNNYSGEAEVDYHPKFYSFPDDIEIIKDTIAWVFEANKINERSLKDIPPIFPYYGHRFLIFHEDKNVLSMYGNDIIQWAANLSKGIANDIFPGIRNPPGKINTQLFWNNKVS